jgi:hypothetical protein
MLIYLVLILSAVGVALDTFRLSFQATLLLSSYSTTATTVTAHLESAVYLFTSRIDQVQFQDFFKD